MKVTLKLDWTEDKALLGSNLSADSVAGIAGSAPRSRLLPWAILAPKRKIPGVRGQRPRLSGVTESLDS